MFTDEYIENLEPAEIVDVVDIIRNEYCFEPEGFTLYSYGAVQAWAQAVQQARSLDQ